MDNEDYRKKIEENILRVIEEKLISQEIDATKAKEIAKLVLNTLRPQMTINQIHDAAQKFDDYFPELASVVIQANNDYHKKVEALVSQHAHKLIASGKVKEASTLMNQALNKKIRLSD